MRSRRFWILALALIGIAGIAVARRENQAKSRGIHPRSGVDPAAPSDPAPSAEFSPAVAEPVAISVPAARTRLNGFLTGLPPLKNLALADRAIQEIAKACRTSPSFLQAAIEALRAGVSPRDWMILVVSLGRVADLSAGEALLDSYRLERDSLRKGFLAVCMTQLHDPEGFSKAYGEELLLSCGLDGCGSAQDLASILPRLVSAPDMTPSLRALLLGDLASTNEADLARGLTHALGAAVKSDSEIRKIMLWRALRDASTDMAAVIADAAVGRPQDADLMSDALRLLEAGPTEAVRDAVALRLARSEAAEISVRLTGLLTDAQTPASTRLRILSGVAASIPSFEHPGAQAIVSLAERSADPLVRRRAIAALGSIRNWSEESRVALHDRLLADPNPDIRIEAIRSIARLGLSLPEVEHLAKTDPSATVRQVAAETAASRQE